MRKPRDTPAETHPCRLVIQSFAREKANARPRQESSAKPEHENLRTVFGKHFWNYSISAKIYVQINSKLLSCVLFAKNEPFRVFNRAAMGRARFLLCTGFINRAAMGRARFLLCTGFINRAAMGRARFLFYTGFIINRAAMGRARFLLCTGFIIFFVGDQTQTSTRPNRVWGFEITQPMMFIRQKLLKH